MSKSREGGQIEKDVANVGIKCQPGEAAIFSITVHYMNT